MNTTYKPASRMLRAEHEELERGVTDLARAAAELSNWSYPDTTNHLRHLRGFLYSKLLPHAEAEENVLYPFLDKILGAEGATETMVADHREIHRRIDAFAALAASVGVGPPSEAELEALREHLYGLWAIVRLHMAKEEEFLFPLLDGRISAIDARTLEDEMASFASRT